MTWHVVHTEARAERMADRRLCDLADDWERQTIANIATRLYGRRTTI